MRMPTALLTRNAAMEFFDKLSIPYTAAGGKYFPP